MVSHGFEYTFGSSIVSDHSMVSLSTRRNRLGRPHLIADRPARRVEPHPVFRHRSNRLGFERVVVYPSADRVAEESLLSNLAAYFDGAVDQLGSSRPSVQMTRQRLSVLIQDRDLVLVLEDLRDVQVVVVGARHAQRFAEIPGIVALGGADRVGTLERLVGLVQLQPERRFAIGADGGCVTNRCLRNFCLVALILLLTGGLAWAQATAELAGR